MSAALAMLPRGNESSNKKNSSKSLRVNDPDDTFEREADKVADTVATGGRVSGWSLSFNRAGHIQRDSSTTTALATAPRIPTRRERTQSEEVHNDEESHRDEQRRDPEEPHQTRPILHSEAPRTRSQVTSLAPATEPSGQRRSNIVTPADKEEATEEIPIQRKADAVLDSIPDAAEVESVIHSSGQALDSETRRSMESRIGFDFSRVRIHTDARAADSAKSLRARAYTVGSNIVFSAGRFAPNTREGRRLLAHELTHVVQQSPVPARAASRALPPPVSVSRAPRQIQRDAEEDAKSLSISDLRHPIEALKKVARKIPGYDLFTVILGNDPISGAPVERNGTNLVGGFLKLIGKKDTFGNLQQSGALDRAFDWLKNEVNQLGFSIEYFKKLVDDAINSVSPSDVFNISAALTRIYEIFKPPLIKAKDFAAHVLNKVFEFIVEGVLEAAGATGVLDMLRKAGAAFSAIAKDPVGFLGHLVDALKKGFNQFKDKILEHLKNAVVDWIFGEIASTGIKIPKPFGFGAIVNLLLQVLGLTYPKLRARLVKALGSEEPVAFLETSFELLTTIATKGLAAAWEEILKRADNLIETVLSAIKDWAITKIVTLAVVQLVALFNPAGAIIKAIQLVYETLRVFIEKAKQIAALISAIADSLSEIAAGNIVKAADYIESTMAKTLPIILNFLAGLIGLGGIGEKIRGIIHDIQEKVGAAVDKVFNYIVEKGRALWAAGKGAVASVVEWWKAKRAFKLGDESHSIYMEGDGDHPQIMVESAPTTLEIFLDNVGASDAEKSNILDLAKKVRWRKGEVQDSKKGADDGQANFDKLHEAISALKVKGLVMPDSEIENSTDLQYGAGTQVTAFLSLKHRKGTSPNKRNDPEAWTELGSIREDKSYVRGHLLNDRLGGLGEWENMMPLTNTANGDFYRNMEQNLIEAVSTGKQLVWVKVEAKYKTVSLPKTGTAKEKEKKAESRLDKLIWSYGPATCGDGKWKKLSKADKKKGKGVGEQIEAVSDQTTNATM